ncbi:hypothetical protein OE88DRAFT_1668168 [Heliocybe sulcata]|uniref:Uncharacterized protein n=1 Tax=Heliocybe sulcata TaxID=5364 RepID=A0A5C3MMB2_9AGAM|nr:hypothetical protein OE88DRAFT_1668168 [Heliocybe sulcata]
MQWSWCSRHSFLDGCGLSLLLFVSSLPLCVAWLHQSRMQHAKEFLSPECHIGRFILEFGVYVRRRL